MSMVRERPPAAPGSRDRLPARLPGLRVALEQEREFRVKHLAADLRTDPTLPETAGDWTNSRVLREIAQTLAAGARHALASIERALHRMQIGEYGLAAAGGQGYRSPSCGPCLGQRYAWVVDRSLRSLRIWRPSHGR
jgi:RNA polymerase-binding transcription factor DksA